MNRSFPEPDSALRIWRASESNVGREVGFLVTHDSINDMVAYVDLENEKNKGAAERLARAISADRSLLERSDPLYDGVMYHDLEDCGKPDSGAAVPAFIYGLFCIPIDADRNADPIEPRPFCRFLLKEMTATRLQKIIAWEAYEKSPYDGGPVRCGTFITEAHDIDLPVAYVDDSMSGGIGGGANAAVAAILADVSWLDRLKECSDAFDTVLSDLRNCGRQDSPAAVPTFLYDLTFKRPGSNDYVRAVPFCRFLAARLWEKGLGLSHNLKRAGSHFPATRRMNGARAVTA